MEVYVVCFDISDDRIRDRVGKRLLRYGERVQKSVFEVSVKGTGELDEMRRELREIAEDDDNIRFYRLCATCRSASSALDGGRIAHFPAVIVL